MINAIVNDALEKRSCFDHCYHDIIVLFQEIYAIRMHHFHLQQCTLFIESSNLYTAKKDFYTNNTGIIISLTLISLDLHWN